MHPSACAPLLVLVLVAAFLQHAQAARVGDSTRVTPRLLLVGGREPRDESRYSYLARIHFLLDDTRGVIANCGGTLVSRRVVLTAAHCTDLAQKSGQNVFLRIGAFNPWLDEATQQPFELRRVTKVVPHPAYVQMPHNRPTSPHDLALLLLDEPVSRSFRTVQLANATAHYPADGAELHAVGWGSTDSYNSQPAFALQEVALPVVSRKLCGQQWRYAAASPGLIKQGHICAGLMSQRSICFGDSGGPLLLRGGSAKSDVQLGITSFSYPTCALPGMPGVFTFVPAYRKWIDEQIAQLDPQSQRPPHQPPPRPKLPKSPRHKAAAAQAPEPAAAAAARTGAAGGEAEAEAVHRPQPTGVVASGSGMVAAPEEEAYGLKQPQSLQPASSAA